MRFARLISSVLLVLVCLGEAAQAQGCYIWDNFSNNDLYPTWVPGSSPNSVVYGVEAGGQLRFGAIANIWFDEYNTSAWSNGWGVDMSQDWAIQMDWFVNPPSPNVVIGIPRSEVGLMCTVLLEGETDGVVLYRAVTITAHRGLIYNGQPLYYDGQSIDYWVDGANAGAQSWEIRSWSAATVYIWYDAAFGVIYFDTAPPGVSTSPMSAVGVGALSPASTATIGIGAYSLGSIPAFSSTSLAADNFCILYGDPVGIRVGACQLLGGCIETVVESCDGTFTLGAVCDDICECEWDVDCSGQVGMGDISLLLSTWGQCVSCTSDLTRSGDVGIQDLLILLEHWGGC